MNCKNVLTTLSLIVFSMAACAQLSVHHIFGDNMILQRDKEVRVWGWADPGKEVILEFNGQRVQTTAKEDRSWEMHLNPMPVNTEPQMFKVICNPVEENDGQAVIYQNVLVGDVWILGGQSNMELDLQRIYHGDEEIASANFPDIRILTIPHGASPEYVPDFERINEWDGWHGRYDLKGYWFVCTPEVVPTFSGMGYVFGRRIYMASQVPIALIDASWGGTTVEGWTSREKLVEVPENAGLIEMWDNRIQADSTKAYDRNNPGASFNGMMNIFGGLAIKGIIFHQGFNNALGDARPKLYEKNIKLMVELWRETFNDPDLPFGIIELSAGGQPQTVANFNERMIDAGTYIREAQLNAYKDLTNIGFVAAYDQQVDWYHPFKKSELSERMARWALTEVYGFDLGWKPALVIESDIKGDEILITFDKEVITHDGRPMEGFAIAGINKRFYPANANYLVIGKDERNREIYDRSRILVSSNKVRKPVAVRYAWARNPLGNLVNNSHGERVIPVPSFRTDNWDWPEAPFAENSTEEFQNHRDLIREMQRQARNQDK